MRRSHKFHLLLPGPCSAWLFETSPSVCTWKDAVLTARLGWSCHGKLYSSSPHQSCPQKFIIILALRRLRARHIGPILPSAADISWLALTVKDSNWTGHPLSPAYTTRTEKTSLESHGETNASAAAGLANHPANTACSR